MVVKFNYMDKKTQTIECYNENASAFVKKFNSIGIRAEDVKRAFSYVKKDNPKVIELGCSNGRDAKEILKYTSDYLGIDISEELVKIAKKDIPNGKFEIADFETFNFPKNIDIVFAFASLIHSDWDNTEKILDKVYKSLTNKGVFYISLKYGDYKEVIKEDKFGIRTNYLYTPEEIEKLAGERYKVIYKDIQELMRQKWFTIVLQKYKISSKLFQ